ncbi:MAG: polyprenyl synthetase family protein [Deinococcota bacterium]|nr:polyprenyl synthetase family protein [Deinococcota bacterium]
MVKLIEAELNEFERALAGELESPVAFIRAIGEDLVAAGGKRLRPSLSFLAGKLIGANHQDAMRVALAVELLHSASLLHDDLIDDARMRRGHEAAFRRYGNVVSVMSGDFMLAKVLHLLSLTNHADFTMLMSETATQICEGEVLQFEVASLGSYSLANYFKIIEGKTAVLLVAALEGVAMLSGACEAQRQALRQYGLSYGRAFQMQDDYLDLLGDPQKLGKPVGGDLKEGKATYPILLLFERGVEEARSLLARRCEREGDVARMIDLVREHGADLAASAYIAKTAQKAIVALSVFSDSPSKQALQTLARREIKRSL